MMGRRNVYLPDELEELAAAELPGVSLSAIVQEALRDRLRLRCEHSSARCATCGHELARAEVEDAAVRELWQVVRARFYAGDHLLSSLDAALVVWRAATRRRHDVGPAPAWSSAERARYALTPTSFAAGELVAAYDAGRAAAAGAATVTDLPTEAESRRRHPTARPAVATPAPALPEELTA